MLAYVYNLCEFSYIFVVWVGLSIWVFSLILFICTGMDTYHMSAYALGGQKRALIGSVRAGAGAAGGNRTPVL